MVGKEELCALSEGDVENEGVLNRIKNTSKSIFLSLYDILQTQSELRQQNMSRKRQRKEKQRPGISLDMQVSQTTEISLGSISPPPR